MVKTSKLKVRGGRPEGKTANLKIKKKTLRVSRMGTQKMRLMKTNQSLSSNPGKTQKVL